MQICFKKGIQLSTYSCEPSHLTELLGGHVLEGRYTDDVV